MMKDTGQERIKYIREDISLKDILSPYLRQWKWMALGILICLGFTFMYLRYRPTVYESHAKLLIKYEQAGSYSNISAFKDMGLFDGISGYNNLYNEVEFLKSRALIEQVVRKLNLNRTIYLVGKKTGFERREFYKDSPIELIFPNDLEGKVDHDLKLTITMSGEKSYVVNEPEELAGKKYQFDELLSLEGESFKLVLNSENKPKQQDLSLLIVVLPYEDIINQYQQNLRIEPISEDVDILRLSFSGPNVDKNNDFLDTLIAAHTSQNIEDQLKVYRNTSMFINSRIDLLSSELLSVETNEENYKTENEFSDITINERSLYDRTLFNDRELVEAEIQYRLAEYLYAYMKENQLVKDLLPANIGLRDEAINKNAAEYNNKVLELNKLLQHSTMNNPVAIKMESDLKIMRSSIMQSLANLKGTIRLEIEKLDQNARRLQSGITELPKHQKQINSLARQHLIKESLYIYLLEKREENEIASSIVEGNSRIVDGAYSSGAPISPKPKIYYIFALLFGGFVPFSIIYLLRLFDSSVTKKDLNALDFPYLGSIPKIKGSPKIVVSDGAHSVEAEAFRILRTNLNFLTGKADQAKVILITSTVAKEGKSFISVNLAKAFQITGKRTLLVGLDMRAPKILDYLGEKNTKGFADYLVDPINGIEQYIITSPHHPGLHILPSGTTPPNPSELIMRSDVAQIFAELRKSFDVIIVDTAPVGMVTDTLLLSEIGDAMLYVINPGRVDKKMLQIPLDLRANEKIRNIGFVLNAVDFSKVNESYGYGYGYGNEEQKQSWFNKLRDRIR